jgi:uncharacterized protein with PIN domain
MELFVVDRMLGRLARWLRVLGYDAVYLERASAEEIGRWLEEGRVLLTKDRRADPWLDLGKVVVIEPDDPREQLRQLVRQLRLPVSTGALFSRCLGCNRPLVAAAKEAVFGEVPDHIWQTHERFRRCEGCGKVFWSGSHADNMRHLLEADFPELRS